MNMMDFSVSLQQRFPDAVTSVDLKGKELYAGIKTGSAPAVCQYISSEARLPLVSMFASDERELCGSFAIYYTFASTREDFLVVLRSLTDPDSPTFESISARVHAAALYEREIKDLFGLVPTGHPDAKRMVFHSNWPHGAYPLRKDYDKSQQPPFVRHDIKFRKITGEGVFEIPVGPVHAGIIEPGHFRFSLAGEPILNLEAQLYFVHKGIEKLAEGCSIERGFYISERISGDETFTNALAYSLAIEKIAGIEVPERAHYMRVLFAELERLTSHLGDLAGIALDVAYGFAAFQFRMMRGWCYLVADELCNMRFLRSACRPGGMRKEFVAGKENSLTDQLLRIKRELADTEEIIHRNSMFIDRVESTGVLSRTIAEDLNAVGPPARAAGVDRDTRRDHPYAAYRHLKFEVPCGNDDGGDVSGRMNIKIRECFESISLMIQAIEMMPHGKVTEPIGALPAYGCAFGMTEAPRGENIHFLMTGENNTLFRYKVRTPSFCNWPALCHAVKGNVVPDFPLINKSFNLSYAGNDL